MSSKVEHPNKNVKRKHHNVSAKKQSKKKSRHEKRLRKQKRHRAPRPLTDDDLPSLPQLIQSVREASSNTRCGSGSSNDARIKNINTGASDDFGGTAAPQKESIHLCPKLLHELRFKVLALVLFDV
jgi:hypothetical protein